MEVKTKMRCGVTRRKCNQISKVSPKIERNESLRKVTSILRKNESLRSAEEVAVLARMTDEVKEVKFRIYRRQRTIERSKEIEDDLLVLKNKCKKLANALQRAKHLVVYTGAGISTAAAIPDYRGPNGIWTLLQQGKQIGKHDLTRADPTKTHMALWKLYRKQYLKFVVSQNCDGLHLRSGLPKRALSEVHGNMYIELCRECKPNAQYWRLFDTTERTARFSHKTGRICHKCGASLVDSIVHFGERGIAQWPLNWAGALHHAAKADVILCLGSSLKVLKKYPWLWAMDKPIKKRPAIFIVNLQWTPKDDVAELKINGKCDKVMELVMEYLSLDIPEYDKFSDPIFAHTSYLSPRELHTTTQPMLNRTPKKDLPLGEDTLDSSDRLPKGLTLGKKMETDEEDDDCPLNVLKIKMNKPMDSEKQELESKHYDVIATEAKDECVSKTNEKVNVVTNTATVESKSVMESEVVRGSHKEMHQMKDGARVKMETADFSCTVNVEESKEVVKSEHTEDSINLSNLKINAIINNNLNVKSCNGTTKIDSSDTVEGISMEILAEEFERVHVEMKTNDNEIHKVSILLVNKSRTPPKKCDKFQQTDPEIDYYRKPVEFPLHNKIKEDVTPELKLLDTGQAYDVTIKKEIDQSHCLNLEKQTNTIAHCTLMSTQVTKNNISMLASDYFKESLTACETKCFEKEKISNSLRNFRRLKEVKKSLFKNEFNQLPVRNTANDVKSNLIPMIQSAQVSKLGHNINAFLKNTEQPIDFSVRQRPIVESCIRVPTFTPEKSMKSSCILKIPKPPLFHSRNAPLQKNDTRRNLAIDLSVPTDIPIPNNHVNERLNNISQNEKEKSSVRIMEDDRMDDQTYASFKKRCENLARAIIQNTLLVNRNELQHAYSGIHSIINPVPFNVQYDFKSVFNALNFIHLGQRLMSRGKPVKNLNHNNNKTVSESIIKKRLNYSKRRSSLKKEPQCKFCYELYKSRVCNFYVAYNSDERFEKYCNNKLVMCDCCGDSDSSDDSEDDLPLRGSKRAGIEENGKSADAEESANSECNSSNMEDGKVLSCNDDLKNGVQINIKDNTIPDSAQAGWFGKGFRKNRRRKR